MKHSIGFEAMYFQIEEYALHPPLREIRCDGVRISLEPKAFDLILHLVEARDRVVTKEELVDAIWDGRAISDATLSSTVKAARKALGDNGSAQKVIRTYHGHGFRLVAAVEEIAEVGAEVPAPVETAEGIDLALPNRPSIAVVPFTCLGADGCALLARGLVQDLTAGLARTRWMFVSSTASASRLSYAGLDQEAIARRLGVRYVLGGSVAKSGKRFRLTVMLSDMEADQVIWADAYDRSMDDIFEIQTEVANIAVAAVESEVDIRERRRALLSPARSLDAWTAYHRASDLLFKFCPDRFEQAERLLKFAARLDPGFARVPAALSFLHWQRGFLGPDPRRGEEIRHAMDYARQSLELDPHDPLGYWALGRTALLSGDPQHAVDALLNAVELNPNFANGQYSLSYAFMFNGQCGDGIDNVQAARRISPYDPMAFAHMAQLGSTHALMGDADAGARWLARAVRQPNHHHHINTIAAWTHELAGRRTEARAYLARARRHCPQYSRRDFLSVFPYLGKDRLVVEAALARLGL